MANVLTFTESLSNSVWVKSSGTITVTDDTHAPPGFAGPLAGMADTVADGDATIETFIRQSVAKGSNDTANWVVSLFVRKDADTTRFPEFIHQVEGGGTTKTRGMRLNTSTGEFAASSFGAPSSYGVIDVDTNWWRIWMLDPDNASGNLNIRLLFYPARASTFGGGNAATATGSIVVWGGNAVKADELTQYEPDPFYEFGDWTTLATLGSTANSYSDTDVALEAGTEYDYRVVASNAGGSTSSNIVSAIPNAEGQAPASILTIHRRQLAGMYRTIGRGVN